jgi:hypothetical protein
MGNKIKIWFKDAPFYFWLVLVIPGAFKQAIPIKEFKGRVMELIISLLAGGVSAFVLGKSE